MLRENLLLLVVLMPSVILHEISHGYVAHRFGDDTAKRAGRLTLNPIAHVDPIGTVLLPGLLAVGGAPFLFGYAKPVPVTVSDLRNPRLHSLMVALAGPATNGALAAASLAAFVVIRPADDSIGWWLLFWGTIANVVLGLFNLLPVPPLDGSAVIEFFLPRSALGWWYRLQRYSIFILFGLLLFGREYLAPIFEWAVDLWRSVQ